jgi:hypothetical protein
LRSGIIVRLRLIRRAYFDARQPDGHEPIVEISFRRLSMIRSHRRANTLPPVLASMRIWRYRCRSWIRQIRLPTDCHRRSPCAERRERHRAQVLSPLDLERESARSAATYSWRARSINYSGASGPGQRYRGPLKGLYMCGAGTHPGGGVTGVPGHNAAREILRDVRRKRG